MVEPVINGAGIEGDSGAEKCGIFLSKAAWQSLRRASGTDREFLECLLLQLRLRDHRALSVANGDDGFSRVRSFLTPAEGIVNFNQGAAVHVYELGLDLHLTDENTANSESKFQDSRRVETAWDHTTCAEDAVKGYPAQIERRDRIIAGVLLENEELKRRTLADREHLQAIEEKLGKVERQWRTSENARISAVNGVLQLEEKIEALKLSYAGELKSLRSFSGKVGQAGWIVRFCYLLIPSLTLQRWKRHKKPKKR